MAADCFFCRFLGGVESDWNRESDVVLRTECTTAFVSPRWWPANAGNVIVIPNDHIPDLETADDALLSELYARRSRSPARCAPHMAATLYERDTEHRFVSPEERAPYAETLRAALGA